MRTDAPLSCLGASSDYDPEAEALQLSAQTARMIAVTEALVRSHRHVDCQGLHDHIGLLCAKALDLPPARTGFLKLELKRLVTAVDSLKATLRESAA